MTRIINRVENYVDQPQILYIENHKLSKKIKLLYDTAKLVNEFDNDSLTDELTITTTDTAANHAGFSLIKEGGYIYLNNKHYYIKKIEQSAKPAELQQISLTAEAAILFFAKKTVVDPSDSRLFGQKNIDLESFTARLFKLYPVWGQANVGTPHRENFPKMNFPIINSNDASKTGNDKQSVYKYTMDVAKSSPQIACVKVISGDELSFITDKDAQTGDYEGNDYAGIIPSNSQFFLPANTVKKLTIGVDCELKVTKDLENLRNQISGTAVEMVKNGDGSTSQRNYQIRVTNEQSANDYGLLLAPDYNASSNKSEANTSLNSDDSANDKRKNKTEVINDMVNYLKLNGQPKMSFEETTATNIAAKSFWPTLGDIVVIDCGSINGNHNSFITAQINKVEYDLSFTQLPTFSLTNYTPNVKNSHRNWYQQLIYRVSQTRKGQQYYNFNL